MKEIKDSEAIYVYTKEIQKEVFDTYNVKVPFYMIYYPKDNFYNSPLYFEMYHPNLEIIK